MNLIRDEFVSLGKTSLYQALATTLDRNTPQYQKLVEALSSGNKFVDSAHNVLLKNLCLDYGSPAEKLTSMINLYFYGNSMSNFSWNLKYLGKSSERFEIIE